MQVGAIMIKNIIDILQKMESACPVECSTELKTNPRGNLVLEWVCLHGADAYKYSTELTPEGDDAMVDLIDYSIQKARKNISENLKLKGEQQ